MQFDIPALGEPALRLGLALVLGSAIVIGTKLLRGRWCGA
jgi:uncharacterized membrane protein YccC